MRYSNPELLRLIKQLPEFSNFDGPENDLRDSSQKNPAFSINRKKGTWYNFNKGEGGRLFTLAKSLNVLPGPEKKIPTANAIWNKSKRNDEAVKLYFSEGHRIPENHYADIFQLFREDHFNGRHIIHPYFSFEAWQSELNGKPFDVPRIQRIWFDTSGRKTDKKHLGKTGETPICFPLPPHNENRESKKAVICEGIENALSIRAYFSDSWFFMATSKSGLKRLPKFMENFEEVLILADHDFDKETYPDKSTHPSPDKTGQAEAWRLSMILNNQANTLGKQNFSCKAVMPGQVGIDTNDSLRAAQLPEFIDGLIDIPEKFRSIEEKTENRTELVVLTLEELLKRETPPRQNLLSPWLPSQGLCMIYAYRETGKTWVALSIAYAVASGGRFLNWHAEKAAGVLYIDGEMPFVQLKERLATIVLSEETEIQAPLEFITPDVQEFGIPDLSTLAGQERIDKLITEETKLIVMDNLSTLIRTGKENEGESWLPVQGWALRLRRRGISVLFIHHAGKGGQQRGTSRREDVLDTVIALRQPTDYTSDKGAYFEIHFEKSRGLYGDEVKPFEARLETHEDNSGIKTINWTYKTLEDSTREKVKRYLDDKWTQKDIADQLGIKKSTVNYHVKKLRDAGLID